SIVPKPQESFGLVLESRAERYRVQRQFDGAVARGCPDEVGERTVAGCSAGRAGGPPSPAVSRQRLRLKDGSRDGGDTHVTVSLGQRAPTCVPSVNIKFHPPPCCLFCLIARV